MSLTAVAIFTSLSFLAYGVSCLSSAWMKDEFERYGLARFRMLTGGLEIAGALGVVIGLRAPMIGFLAALGLTFLMIGALGVRLRIRDSLRQTLPSAIYLALTLYLTLLFGQTL